MIRTEDEGRVHLHVASLGLAVIGEFVVVEREAVAGRDCVADDVEDQVREDNQTAKCLSCTVMSDMGWHMMREVVDQPSATTAEVTPTVVIVVSLALVVGYCVVEERYICQSSRYRCGP
jgi:hypothetical protein